MLCRPSFISNSSSNPWMMKCLQNMLPAIARTPLEEDVISLSISVSQRTYHRILCHRRWSNPSIEVYMTATPSGGRLTPLLAKESAVSNSHYMHVSILPSRINKRSWERPSEDHLNNCPLLSPPLPWSSSPHNLWPYCPFIGHTHAHL